MTRIAILSGPYPVDDHLGGIGLRLWELAQSLADTGHDVTLALPRATDFTHPGITTTLDATAAVDAADAIVTTDLPDTALLLRAHRAGTTIVAENAPPIEHLHYDRLAADTNGGLYRDTVARWHLQLLLADHLVVRSEAERAATLGALVAAGRTSGAHHRVDPALGHLLSLIPIGFNRHSAKIADGARADPDKACDVLWNGGVWDYCQPGPVLEALAATRAAAGTAPTLRLLYEPAPAAADSLRAHARDLGVADLLHWPCGPVAHRDRDAWLASAKALVITGGRTAENTTCHRLRLRDAALYGLPVVVDGHGASGELVAALGIGPVVDPDDPHALGAALVAASTDGPARHRYRSALAAARGRFTLEEHLGPLQRVLHACVIAPDRDERAHRARIDALLKAHPALHDPAPTVL
ncbi:hypothetical protein ACFZBU_39245 [Embleya sp. NPDC008237]|uniref:hypothetical protein n=1 Tax=Embleya sp. NPDC008237 TaxID=3363978 RepID=UPI0036E7DB20